MDDHPQETGTRPRSVERRRLLLGAAGVGAALALRNPLGGLASALSADGFVAPAQAATSSLLDEIEAFAAGLTTVPGCAVAAVDGLAGVSGTFATGLRDVDKALPFASDTILTIDSVTKQFTTTMLAQAVKGGLGRNGPLTLGSPIGPYLAPYLADAGYPMPTLLASITLQQLADYTSGLPNEPTPFPNPRSAYTIPELALWLSKIDEVKANPGPDDLAFVPGTGYLYSDVAVDLLGFILADQLLLKSPGTPNFSDLVTAMLLRTDVLHMADTSVAPPPAQQPRVATGYLYKDKSAPANGYKVATKVNDPPTFFGGGGVLRSTANDMLRFLEALIAPPPVAHLQEAIPLAAQVYYRHEATHLDLGLGWNPIEHRADPTGGTVDVFLKDGGGSVGCTALLGYAPKTQRALFFMTNVDGADVAQQATFIQLLSQFSQAPPSTTTTASTTTTTDPAAGAAASTPATAVDAAPTFAG